MSWTQQMMEMIAEESMYNKDKNDDDVDANSMNVDRYTRQLTMLTYAATHPKICKLVEQVTCIYRVPELTIMEKFVENDADKYDAEEARRMYIIEVKWPCTVPMVPECLVNALSYMELSSLNHTFSLSIKTTHGDRGKLPDVATSVSHNDETLTEEDVIDWSAFYKSLESISIDATEGWIDINGLRNAKKLYKIKIQIDNFSYLMLESAYDVSNNDTHMNNRNEAATAAVDVDVNEKSDIELFKECCSKVEINAQYIQMLDVLCSLPQFRQLKLIKMRSDSITITDEISHCNQLENLRVRGPVSITEQTFKWAKTK